MNGKIQVGNHEGVYVICLQGDVRVTISGSFDHYIEAMLSDSRFSSVLVDLSQASAIDSTSLGVLAKLSLAVQGRYAKLPTLLCSNPDILRVLANMGYDDVYAIVDEQYHSAQNLADLPMSTDMDEDLMRERVIDAHRTLMAMNETNANTFKDLVAALEAEGYSRTKRA